MTGPVLPALGSIARSNCGRITHHRWITRVQFGRIDFEQTRASALHQQVAVAGDDRDVAAFPLGGDQIHIAAAATRLQSIRHQFEIAAAATATPSSAVRRIAADDVAAALARSPNRGRSR